MSDPTRTQHAPATGADAESRATNDATQPRAPSAPGLAFGPPAHAGEVGTLGRYRVLKQLGAGGMGAVYLGYHTGLQCKVALKVMLQDAATDSAARDRFLREARTAAQVKSDHVVTIHDVDEANGVPFIAMEYLHGVPLDAYLTAKGELPLGQAVRIARECAMGLAAVHAEGLIHRDIKPANVWLEAPNGRAKLLDFGLARAATEARDITGTGGIVGTVRYMSPQQGRGEFVDARTDLWSLGVVLYRLCTGRMPFDGQSQMAVLTSIAVDAPPAPRALNASLPPALEVVILKLLAKDPAARFQTAHEVAEALAAVERGDGPQVVAVSQALPVSAPTENVWESIADDSQSIAVPMADPDATEATRASARPYRRRVPRQIQIGCMITVPLCLLIGLGFAVNWAMKKPGEEVAQVPKEEPYRTKGLNPPNLPPKGKVQPDPEPPPPGAKVYPLPADLIAPMTPVKPEKVFTLDHLDPAKHVAADERYGWQSKELVALLGSHRQRVPDKLNWVRVAPDGAFALGGNGHGASWRVDLKTGRVTDGPPVRVVSEDFRRGANGHKVFDLTDPNAAPVEYLSVGEVRAFLTDNVVLAVKDNLFALRTLNGKGAAEVGLTFPGALHFALSPERKHLALVFADETCRVYDVLPAGVKERFELPAPDGRTARVAPLFSETGRLATVMANGNLRVWDVSGDKLELRAKLPFSNAAHLTRPGAHLVALGDPKFEVFSVNEKPDRWESPDLAHGRNHTAVASASDGTFVTAQEHGSLRVWEIKSGVLNERNPLLPQTLLTANSAVSPDGRFAVVREEGATARGMLLNLADLTQREVPSAGDYVGFGPDGSALFTSGDGVRVRRAPEFAVAPEFARDVTPRCFSPDGKWLACTSDTELAIWDVSASPPKLLWKVPSIKAQRADFTPDGRFLIARGSFGPHPGKVRVWALTASGPKLRYETDSFAGNAWDALSPDGRTLAVCEYNGNSCLLCLYDIEQGVPKVRRVLSTNLMPGSGEFAPNGRALLALDSTVKVLDATTGAVLYQPTLRGAPIGARFHPDGKHIFVTNADRTTYVLRLPKDVFVALDDPDRKALEYVFSVGGAVSVNVGGEERSAKRFAEMPAGVLPFRVSLEYQKNVTPETLAVFRDCRRLVGFNAHSTDITDAALAHVAVHAGLKHLDLHVCPRVTDAGLAHFKNCKQIEHLNLAQARNVTDAGLAHYAGCANLTFLDVRETKVTPGKIAELAKALPNCKIVHNGGVIEPAPRAEGEREAAEAVIRLRGKVRTRTAAGTRECSALGELPNEPFSVVGITLYGRKYAPEELAACRACRNLTSLQLNGESVTDECLAHFANCGPLTELAITSRAITYAGLAHFANQQSLSNLSLSSCTNVTGTGLAHFKDCKALVVVSLSSTKVTDGDLAHTAAWGKLGSLYLVETALTDAGLVHLERHKNLTYLNLDGSKLTDAGLKHLEGLRALRALSLRHMPVTEPALKALKAKLHPDCQIEWDKGTLKPAAKAGADDRETAKYVLGVGGRVRTRTATETVPVFKLEELPAGPLAVVYLELIGKDLSDDGWQKVAGLRALKEISINGPHFTDDIAAQFDCPEVEEVRITGTKVGDRGLAALVAGKKLRRANVGISPVGDDGVKALAACPDLIDLTLTKTAVTNAGLAHLSGAKKLIWLHLNDTAITDAGLKHLEGLQALRQLSVKNTSVTEPALKALKLKLHPDCQIDWDKGTVKP